MALAACGSPATPHDAFGLPLDQPITQADLLGHPEAHLYYPGSRVIHTQGANQSPSHSPDEEPDPAYVGAILAAPVKAEALYAFYERWLSTHGFHQVPDYRPADQVSGIAYETDQRVQVQVGVLDPAALRRDSGVSVPVPPGGVLYELFFVGYAEHPSGDSRP